MFNRKKEAESKECNHKWKDFGVSVSTTTLTGAVRLEYTAFYVCIWCRASKTVKLGEDYSSNSKQADSKIEEMEKTLDLEHEIIIRKNIADFQLLDEEYLRIYEAIKNDDLSNIVLKFETPAK